jgi:transcriptional regulator with XRE-family HTH domain
MRRPIVDPQFGVTLRRLREQRGLSLRELARDAVHGKSYLHELETGLKQPTLDVARRLDEVLGAGGELASLVRGPGARVGSATAGDSEIEALELARRVEASDVGHETLTRLERAVDDLATSYATTPPQLLLRRVRQHLAYVEQLLDARKTLDQQRRLLVVGAWMSLLSATVLVDLRERAGAAAHLATAKQLAEQAGHAEIQAWCYETAAWQVLTDGDLPAAVDMSRRAQAIAPRGSSALVQATAQEGRAWARMRRGAETRDALDRVDRLVTPLPVPERPEHHYRYDPDKALSYTATTLAWARDPAAEEYARAVIARLEATAGGVPRPRRIASARLDLGLALITADKPDEAADAAVKAITSGRVVPSNWWRATELLAGVEAAGIPEVRELRDAYETYRPAVSGGENGVREIGGR